MKRKIREIKKQKKRKAKESVGENEKEIEKVLSEKEKWK